MHPSLEYALISCVAAAGSFLLTPLARKLASRWGAVAWPRERDVHAVATPRMGGVALFLGFTMAILLARALPTLRSGFTYGPDFDWILVACAIICLVGMLDDRYELDSLTKLAGQVVAAGVMVIKGGVQLTLLPEFWGHAPTLFLGSDLAVPLTILLMVATINAINFIDGLDGLAAGVTAIGAGAFFVYAYHLAVLGYTDVAAAPALLSAALAGSCVGFLPHNFAPARVFMGDSGSMLIGLVLSAAAVTATTTADPQSFNSRTSSLPLLIPLLIPLAVLALPLFDLTLATIRRVGQGQSPFAPDKRHLHHRMLALGHTQRRAVLLLYFWSALLAGGGVTFAITHRPWTVMVTLAGLAALGLVVSVVPRLQAARRVGAHR
jgi:UDP-GlcNAc:undecaprenyl-phosphate/decaprenyl-phosphate GlcNAc-1-phosphate transferase